jgi:hypothetical protein
MKYPLYFEVHSKPSYFQKREVYRLTDIIYNPILLAIMVPMILLVFLSKLLPQRDEMQEVFEQTNDIFRPNLNLPDITDWFVQRFGGPRRQRSTSDQAIAQDTPAPISTQQKTNSKRVRKQKH